MIPATFRDVWTSARQLRRGGHRLFGIVGGTSHPAFRGVIARCRSARQPLMVRYDATLRCGTRTFLRKMVKRLILPVLFSQVGYVGYTGRWAKEYLLHYRARERQLFWYPYTVDHDLLSERAALARA